MQAGFLVGCPIAHMRRQLAPSFKPSLAQRAHKPVGTIRLLVAQLGIAATPLVGTDQFLGTTSQAIAHSYKAAQPSQLQRGCSDTLLRWGALPKPTKALLLLSTTRKCIKLFPEILLLSQYSPSLVALIAASVLTCAAISNVELPPPPPYTPKCNYRG